MWNRKDSPLSLSDSSFFRLLFDVTIKSGDAWDEMNLFLDSNVIRSSNQRHRCKLPFSPLDKVLISTMLGARMCDNFAQVETFHSLISHEVAAT